MTFRINILMLFVFIVFFEIEVLKDSVKGLSLLCKAEDNLLIYRPEVLHFADQNSFLCEE